MKPFPTVAVLLALVVNVWAQTDLGLVSTKSASGQFTISAPHRVLDLSLPPELVTNRNYIVLETTLLAVTCERVKKLVCEQLVQPPDWQDRIYIALQPGRSGHELVTVLSERFKDGWRYKLAIPRLLERRQLVRALVSAVLLEIANRQSGQRSAELPAWLTEGFTQMLLTEHEQQLMLPPPSFAIRGVPIRPMLFEARAGDALESVRTALREHPPLSIAQLSWPSKAQMAGHDGEVYAHSTHLFVAELLKLPDGPASMLHLLRELPQTFNWQTAFLESFKSYFQQQLDLEKWWSLQLVHFTSLERGRIWPAEESWTNLNHTLNVRVAVRRGPGELPVHVEVPLQTIAREWGFDQQMPVIQNVIRQLDRALLHVAPQFTVLVADYRARLQDYLDDRLSGGIISRTANDSRAARRAIRSLTRELDALDTRRHALLPPSKPQEITRHDAPAPDG